MGINPKSTYDSFVPTPPVQRKKKYWDPIATLNIINPDRGCLTCVGFAPRCGRRCRNPINQANRASAFQLLEDLSYIDVSTADINAKLHQLARLTLCLRYHQGQKDEMVEEWSRKTDPPQTTSRNSTNVKIDPDEMEERWKEMEELFARLVHKMEEADQRYRDRYDRQSAQEERARRQREQETRKSREREREREKQEHEKKQQEEKERKKREEKQRQKEEQQARDREAREREERNERIRQKAEQARKERERKAREQAAKEREEWDGLWLQYVRRWDDIKKNGAKGKAEKLREIIPWPVKSGHWKDVSGSAVEEFFQKAPPHTDGAEKVFKIMQMECLKWHTDRIPKMFGVTEVTEDNPLAGLFKTVAQVVIEIRKEADRKRER